MKKIYLVFYLIVIMPTCLLAQLSDTIRNNTVKELATLLKEKYVIPANGEKYAEYILSNLERGTYNNISDPEVFAQKLTEDINKIKPDKHLRVEYSPHSIKNIQSEEISEEAKEENRRRKIINEKSRNYGFKKVEILSGNVGYLRFDEFPSERAAETIISAFGFLKHSNAVIIDLRNNHGGNPEIVSFIGGYFFSDDYSTEFSSIYNSIRNKVYTYKTPLYLPGNRLDKVELYVLVGPETFSAAESFAYDMQQYNRATIIGTRTQGGAHAAKPLIINNDYLVVMPFATPTNPVTKTNWEGIGILPDISCAAEDALMIAHSHILDKIISDNQDKSFINGLGYELIGKGKIQLAIEVFKKNVELHPDYANGYDSLGEAYMKNGNKELAIRNYEKTLELDPDNNNAREMLKELKYMKDEN